MKLHFFYSNRKMTADQIAPLKIYNNIIIKIFHHVRLFIPPPLFISEVSRLKQYFANVIPKYFINLSKDLAI